MDASVFLQYTPILIQSSVVTLQLFIASLVLGTILGLLIALMRLSRNPMLSGFAFVFSWILRSTPLLVLLFFAYYALPAVGLKLSAIAAAIVGISIDAGAYKSEIIRAGIISVDPGQYEAARSLGMSPVHTMRCIILPQAVRVIIPPYVSNAITLLKGTSLAAVITVPELLGDANRIISSIFRPVEILLIVAVIYIFYNTVLAILQVFLERSFGLKT